MSSQFTTELKAQLYSAEREIEKQAATIAALQARILGVQGHYAAVTETLTVARDKAEADAAALQARVDEVEKENKRLHEVLAEANNKWRHEFDAAVGQAADKLFARLSWQHTVKQNPAMAEKVK